MAVERRERMKPAGPNQVWSLDFVSDQLADGRRFRALTVVAVPGLSTGTEDQLFLALRIAAVEGITSRNGKNRTLRPGSYPVRLACSAANRARCPPESNLVRKNSITLDGMCPSIQMRTLF